MRFIPVFSIVGGALVALGCSSDDSGGTKAPTETDGGAPSAGPSGAAGEPAAGDACAEGCRATLAAACDNGPASRAVCESDCHDLAAGKCAKEYATLQSCAEGQPVTCSPQGLPTVAACAEEQSAFVACLNG